jgi:L-alanine-DL-glutamate epimerase-like enolase superfamily enzyme
VEVHTARTFTIATGSADAFPVVVALLEHEGHVGLGEASPSKRVTGEDVKSIGHFLDWAAGEVAQLKPADWDKFLDHVHQDICGNPSARCALDLAMHDLVGKMRGVSARELYGLPSARLETSMTIPLDMPQEMAALALDYRMRGFGCLKLKLGDADEDVARVEAVRRAAPDARLRADANTGWTEKEAREVLPQLLPLGVEFVEQPVHPERMGELVELSKWSPIPIYADESVLDVHDVERLAAAGFRGGVNLKLQKTGGIRPALVAARAARAKGYWVQMGCNIETSIGISGALQLLPLLDHADLDGNLLLADDPYVGVEPVEGWYDSPVAPGLGVAPRL